MGAGRSVGVPQQNGTVENKSLSEWVVNYLSAGYELIPKKENKIGGLNMSREQNRKSSTTGNERVSNS